MKNVLHILTKPADAWAERTVREHAALACDQVVEVIDLTAGEPDYELLLDRVFKADTIVAW